MTRDGTVVLLGAGASAAAGYPTADGLLALFRETLKGETSRELELRERVRNERATAPAPGRKRINLLSELPPGPTTEEWFRTMWGRFEEVTSRLRPLAVPRMRPDGRPNFASPAIKDSPVGAIVFPPYSAPREEAPPSPAPTPYLETFFAFYDDYMRPIIAAVEGDPGALAAVQHRFRNLRTLAVKTVYRALGAYGRPPATYLRRLFEFRGPNPYGCAIVTLNFDVTLEQVAAQSSLILYDGFASSPGMTSRPLPESLASLWAAVSENGHEFIGFAAAPDRAKLLLKLHGSMGWYVLEEGSGDIGSRDELRHNAVYAHFRVPYEFSWRADMESLSETLAVGGAADPVTRTSGDSLSRKAGAVWVRPCLVFARALKTHPDYLWLDVTATFARLLERAASILVIGYSWSDPHVNDLILDAVARGASLINVSRSSRQEKALALWMHRFPTTFGELRKRLYMFGGGAQAVLEGNRAELPSGRVVDLELVESSLRLPIELSLARNL